MAVGLSGLPQMYPVAGIKLATVEAGIKYQNRKDLVMIDICPQSSVAGVFTTNRYCAAPVIVSKEHLANGCVRAFLINTGSANAGTGSEGLAQARNCCVNLAATMDYLAEEVMPFSTGVIGELLPMEKMVSAISEACNSLCEDGWNDAANGIMTTDTVPKGTSEKIVIDGKEITITGISKGAGMIKPNMATMLAFVATDANVSQALLQKWLVEIADQTFNKVTVDGDTSTNDSCMLIATGKSGIDEILPGTEAAEIFYNALKKVFTILSQAIIRDGEGATKFITLDINGAVTKEDAEAVAYAIAESPLVKTAMFAGDPNWGRLLATIGRAKADVIDVEKISLYLGDVCLVKDGEPDAEYTEEKGQKEMAKEEITVTVDLGIGSEKSTVWTCDFSYDYIKINAEYRS
ncbi:MAG: bifunctional glutamate N-acetyltransferase/amino-acid acetyltransferase ArgJ [Gammaproteobacteria bacterium]|nr:MAG: bifunctional glutamate N-acetyltransferase/amino-acid acetyltransferase ArgJ [Gammaproteobacteria bacterium]